jgi:hypothetical protein
LGRAHYNQVSNFGRAPSSLLQSSKQEALHACTHHLLQLHFTWISGNLRVNSLKQNLLIDITFNPPLFLLDNIIFKGKV